MIKCKAMRWGRRESVLVIKQEKKKTLPRILCQGSDPKWISLVQARAIQLLHSPNLENKAVTWMD